MQYSLTVARPDQPVSADVVVVGAGLAGLVLAYALANMGLTVIVLESGSDRQIEDVHPLNKVEQVSQEYLGAMEGRFRGLGGTSTRWGGALLPYLDSDLRPHPCGWHDGWGLSTDDLSAYLTAIEQDFGVSAGSYEGDADSRCLPSFEPRLPKWPSFKNRSTANVYRRQIKNDGRVTVWTDATVTDLQLDESRVSGVVARNATGARIEVEARHVAIAAGAIETTRLLLLFNRAHGDRLFPAAGPLGKGFHDHISAPVAKLEATNRSAITRLFSFRFVRGGMRNLRFELSADARAAKSLPAAFLHVAFAREEVSGFDGIRRVYQSAQKGMLPALPDLANILRDLPWFMQAVWWRFAEKRVLPPSKSNFEMHLVTEQHPHAENRIALSDRLVDSFGLPLAQIDWRVREEDIAFFHSISALAIDEWASGPLGNLASLIPRNRAEVEEKLSSCGGIFHPAGTTRIGSTVTEGVVNNQLRVHGVPGLWVIATSVFPAVGGTSPSLGLMQFAARAAERISAATREGR
jgi:choline dehydrogenase-like flavoprotein